MICFTTRCSDLIYNVTVDHSFKHGCFPISIQYLPTALERILFSSVVIVFAFHPGIPGSNPVQILYFCHAFIHSFRTLFVRIKLLDYSYTKLAILDIACNNFTTRSRLLTTLKKKPFENKTFWEKEKMLVTSIFSFSHNVFHPSPQKINFSVTFILLSASPFSLDRSKNLSFGKELKLY